MADTPPLKLGIEIEAVFNPHDKDLGLLIFQFAAKLAEGHDDMCSGYNDRNHRTKKWEVLHDDSLRGGQKTGPCEPIHHRHRYLNSVPGFGLTAV
jgi:hypothetical protein